MTTTEILGAITAILTIVGSIVAATRYLTQVQLKVRQEQLEAERKALERTIRELEIINQDLRNQIAVARRVGTAALVRKMAIDEELLFIMKAMQAQAASIFVPLRSRTSSEPEGLIFLSIQPLNEQTLRLRRKIIPMTSSAGFCLRTGKPYATSNPKSDPTHYDRADKISGYHTEDLLNYPLWYRGEVVGVLQLLNRMGNELFSEKDIPLVEPFIRPLAEKVAAFVYNPENLEIIGIASEHEQEQATILVCDLTQSSLLFHEMGTSAAVQHINEFFERICDIGLAYGATIDKYTGDGVLLKFNVPRRIKNHTYQAAKASLEMKRVFDKMKSEWCTMGEPLTSLYIRIGIAMGQIFEAIVGHPQYQHLTVFGPPVNIATNLCDIAPRDRSVILIDEQAYRELQGKALVAKISKAQLGKVTFYAEAAYELQGLAEESL